MRGKTSQQTSRVQFLEVTKYFGPGVIAPGLNLEIPAGAYCTFLGPSGCGKTTLLRLIAGLEAPTSGKIWIGDRLVSDGVPPEERRLGMVFQSYAVWPHMTVRQNVAFPLECRRAHRDENMSLQHQVDQAFQLVELTALETRRPHELSGGQQQRVALARALVCSPAVASFG